MRADYMASVLLSLSAGVPCIRADKQHWERQPTEGGERSHGRESFTSSEKKQEPCPRASLCPDSRSRHRGSPCRRRGKRGPCPRTSLCPDSRSRRRGSPCRRRGKRGPCPRASPCPRSRSRRYGLVCPPA